MAFTEDLGPFFSDFGVSCTPEGGAAVTVIFDRAYVSQLTGEVSATGPIAVAKTSDVSAWSSHEQIVTIAGLRYLVRDIQPDGTGLSTVILEEVA